MLQLLKDEERSLIADLESAQKSFEAFLKANGAKDAESFARNIISDARYLTDKLAQLEKVRHLIRQVERLQGGVK